jgi:hypothetical protein
MRFRGIFLVANSVMAGTVEDMDKFSRRQVRVTKEHNEECRKLLGLMGIPVVVVRPLTLVLSFISRI